MRIFVTGATGFVGENVADDLATRGHAVIEGRRAGAIEHGWAPFSLEAPVIPGDVDAVVHCAAIATVKECDADAERAERQNVDATRVLAVEAKRRGIPLVFTSTDLVFDGASAPYDQDARPTPPTLYGQTKARAERAVLDADARHVVLRLALVVGTHGGRPGGFLSWLVEALRAGRPVSLFTNQVRAPLFCGDIAPIVEAAAYRRLSGGIYHLASGQPFTREEIGRAVARALGLSGDSIVPTRLERAPDLPAVDDCTLRTTRVTRELGVTFTSLDDALAKVRARISA